MGTGFGRTGTDSMRAALEILGFGPCHHMRELIKDPEHERLWRTAESWWASFEKTILPGILSFTETEATPKSSELIGPRVFHDRADDRVHCIAVYEANVAAVKEHVPAERLLVHRLGDGWGPLCAHLGVPVPDIPYPNSNSTRAFQDKFLTTSPA